MEIKTTIYSIVNNDLAGYFFPNYGIVTDQKSSSEMGRRTRNHHEARNQSIKWSLEVRLFH
jgi:hypothetical protein